MLLYGASGHAAVIIDILKSRNVIVNKIFDDDPLKRSFNGVEVLNYYNPNYLTSEEIIISIGHNKIREKINKCIKHRLGTAIHISSILSDTCSILPGTVIMQGVIIQANAKIGKNVIINTSSSIDHDCVIGDFVHISPGATICGNVQVEKGTHIGAGSVVIQNIKIGKWATVGAGAVIIRNIPDYAVVVGNPGKIIKYNTYKNN